MFLKNKVCCNSKSGLQPATTTTTKCEPKAYRKISNIIRTKSQNLSDCRLVLQLPLSNPLKPGVNTLRPRQNGRHFPDEIFKCIFLNENVLVSIKISLKFIPKGPINNIPALVQTMAWRRPGDRPLYEPMMIISLTHICVARPQSVNLRMKITPGNPFAYFGRKRLPCGKYNVCLVMFM